MASHVKCLEFLSENVEMQSILETIAQELTRPAFIPLLNKHVYPQGGDRIKQNDLNVPGTLLAHAIQILLFAPLRHTPRDDPIFRSGLEPKKRYPTPTCPADTPAASQHHGGQESESSVGAHQQKLHVGRYTLDDINRGLVLLRLCINRRKNSGKTGNPVLAMNKPSVSSQLPPWFGYHNPRDKVALEDPFNVPDNALSVRFEREITTGLAIGKAWRDRLPESENDDRCTMSVDSDVVDDEDAGVGFDPVKCDKQWEKVDRLVGKSLRSLQMATRIDIWTALVQLLSSEEPGCKLKAFFHKFPVPDLPGITMKAFRAIIDDASNVHANTQPDIVSPHSRARATSFQELVNPAELLQYMNLSLRNPTMKAILDREPGKRELYIQAIKTDFIMDRVMSNFREDPEPPLQEWSNTLQLAPWPNNDLWDGKFKSARAFTSIQFAGKSR